jgi:hypothetical protein
MTKFDCIFINGDSYSAEKNNGYGNFLSQILNIPVINIAVLGTSNDRILRSSIEYIHELKQQYQNPLIIVGWSFIRRIEVWYYGDNTSILKNIPDVKFNEHTKLIGLDFLINNNATTLEQKVLVNEDAQVHKALTDFYTKLYLFANLLEAQNLKYLFFSAACNTDCPLIDFPFVNLLFQSNWVAQHPHIYKLHEFCIMNWAKDNDLEAHPLTGHLSTAGHEKFAHYLLDVMANKNLTSVQNPV